MQKRFLQFRIQESKKLTLEEVTSKETERPATDEEILALAQQQQQQQLSADADGQPSASGEGVVEISVEKDIVVEEFKRVESVHEDKVNKCKQVSSINYCHICCWPVPHFISD